MSQSYPLTEEEANLARRQAASSVRVTRDPDSDLRRKQKFEAEERLRDKQLMEYGQKIIEVQEQKARADADSFSRVSGGRNKLIKKQGQVLFSEANCIYCDIPVMKPLDGWNMYRVTSGYIGADTYETSHQNEQLNFDIKHSCVDTTEVLSRKIEVLKEELDAYKSYVNTYFKRIPTF